MFFILESPGEKSDLSSLKRKKNQHHSSNGNNIPTRPTLFKSKSLLEDEGSLSGDEGASGNYPILTAFELD